MTDDSTLPISRRRALQLAGLTAGGLALGGTSTAFAQQGNSNGNDAATYRVTVSNLTSGQPFTPPAVAAHSAKTGVFSVGEPASEAVKEVAENGNLGPLGDAIAGDQFVRASAVGSAPLVPASDPGGTGLSHYVTLELGADRSAKHLSFISMLIGTNDGFTGLDTVELPKSVGESNSYYASSFDAGTEENTERFTDMVPEAQILMGQGDGSSGAKKSDPGLAEDGVITPHAGIMGTGDLDPTIYGWRDPAALVHVERID
jgi:hypothetical protein